MSFFRTTARFLLDSTAAIFMAILLLLPIVNVYFMRSLMSDSITLKKKLREQQRIEKLYSSLKK